jgi:hypothetical protein
MFDLQDSAVEPSSDEVFEVATFADPAPVDQPTFESRPPEPARKQPVRPPRTAPSRRWTRLRWIARLAPIAVFITVLVVNLVQSVGGTQKPRGVTPDEIRSTAGLTVAPFVGTRACDVYVVPLDQPSEAESAAVTRFLARNAHVASCVTPSLALSPEMLDGVRHQVNAGLLIDRLIDAFRPVWHTRPSTILGVTALDVYWPPRPDWSFAFAGYTSVGHTQGYAAVSSARMGQGSAWRRRLETIAMRYVGFLYFGLRTSSDEHSALYPTLLGLDDLDRMRPQFGEPPLSARELRRARARFLRGA